MSKISTPSGKQSFSAAPLINLSTNPILAYVIHLADNALILGQRNAEWTGHGPVLEQDIAISNIALDLIGQARNFYQYAATLINKTNDQPDNPATEDSIAYLRDAKDFRNCLLAELPKGDWAVTVLRQFFISTYQYYLYQALQHSTDDTVAAIAEKSFKEVSYHLRWSAEWVIRLGDGTMESNHRMKDALALLWPYTAELTTNTGYETSLALKKTAIDLQLIKAPWLQKVNEVLLQATLQLPADQWMQSGGKDGMHTEHLGYILAEMQFLQRAYPGAEW